MAQVYAQQMNVLYNDALHLFRPPYPLTPTATTTTTATAPNEMNDNERNSPNSTANFQRAHGGTSPASGPSDVPFAFSSWEDELRRDEPDTVAADDASVMSYSYYSTWSSNYTMSNLPGPGRNLGNLYSKAGAALEQRLRKRLNRAAMKAVAEVLEEAKRAEAEALDVVESRAVRMLLSDDLSKNEKACEALLICAKSDDVNIQYQAFEEIVNASFWYPSRARSAFASFFERRREISNVIAFSWKRPGVEYSIRWLYRYKLASRCLSTQLSPVIEAVAHFDDIHINSLDFSAFEELLSSCSDTIDLFLAIPFISWYWNGEGLDAYVRRKGFDDPVLLEFATGLIACWELYFSNSMGHGPHVYVPLHNSGYFVNGMFAYLGRLELDELVELSEEDAWLVIWVVVFKLYHVLRSCIYKNLGSLAVYPSIAKPWKELCNEHLPKPEHAKLRERLLRLEDVHGPAIRKRFPPVRGSLASMEEQA